jgi:hypothetical protein
VQSMLFALFLLFSALMKTCCKVIKKTNKIFLKN